MQRANVPVVGQGYTTNDYVRLRDPLYLTEYKVTLVPYANVPPIEPFATWNAAKPTQSLVWYDAYNKTKHHRAANLSEASLLRCIEAVAANVILFCVRYSAPPLYEQSTPVASLVSHLFSLELANCDPATFYVPLVDFPATEGLGLTLGETRSWAEPWTVLPLAI